MHFIHSLAIPASKPPFNRISAIWRFKHSDAIEIRDGIIFDFYTGLSHVSVFVVGSNHEKITEFSH